MSTQELDLVIRGFNDTARPYPSDRSIHGLFEERARADPAARAIVDGSRVLTYGELSATVNALASALLRIEIGVGERVAVMMPRSADMIIAQLALLAIGAVYVPIDPDWPVERRQYVFRDAAVRYVLGATQIEIDDEGAQYLNIRSLSSVAAEAGALRAPQDIKSSAPAYIMYTSGSTGVPKGVVVPHVAISKLAFNNGYADIVRTDRVGHASNPAFDASTFEVWAALLNGAQVVIIPKDVLLDVGLMARFIVDSAVNVLFLTTAIFNHYASTDPRVFRGLKYVLFGGEVCSISAVQRVLAEGGPEFLSNMYGPTETTTFATHWPIHGGETTTVPIGRPISNTRIYVLDTQMNAVAVGDVGEIYIGGDGVALGYVNKPELAAQRFIPDPFSSVCGRRLYRTGDLGRWRPDGAVEYVGRNDRQVKIRGFRIEPEEIESVLNTHERVAQSALVCRKDRYDGTQLICYATLSQAVPPESAAQWRQQNSLMLREYLAGKLPDYMIPSQIVILPAFPLTSSGKIDRQAIEAWEPPEQQSYGDTAEPQTPTERLLAEVWRDVLGSRQIGVDDSFFDSGGDSIMAARIVAELGQRAEYRATRWMILEYPTIRELAAAMSQQSASEPTAGIAADG